MPSCWRSCLPPPQRRALGTHQSYNLPATEERRRIIGCARAASTPAAGGYASARLLSHHRSLWAADWTTRLDTVCILDVNRQSRTASETIARNVRSQLGRAAKGSIWNETPVYCISRIGLGARCRESRTRLIRRSEKQRIGSTVCAVSSLESETRTLFVVGAVVLAEAALEAPATALCSTILSLLDMSTVIQRRSLPRRIRTRSAVMRAGSIGRCQSAL